MPLRDVATPLTLAEGGEEMSIWRSSQSQKGETHKNQASPLKRWRSAGDSTDRAGAMLTRTSP